MSGSIPISASDNRLTAPTPVNTPLTNTHISQGIGLSRPTVPDISEEGEGDGGPENSTGSIQNQLSSLVQSRLGTLIGKSSGYVENLPFEVKKKVEALKGIQVDQNILQTEYKRECLELEKKVWSLFPG